MSSSKVEPTSRRWNLTRLTPEFVTDDHGVYADAIESALADYRIRNIALSGTYGVGKSSILCEVAKRNPDRVVELSLSTLAPIEASKLDDSVPKQATTPTNRIQQEIVKQLLYRENPRRTPGSRFRRIERFNWWRELGKALLVGLVVATVFLLAGWSPRVSGAFPVLAHVGYVIHLIVWALATAFALVVSFVFYGRLHIKQFSAGSATVTLEDNSVSYFDQYLDEIVYFFEVSKRDVVIFEDIDRFNDSQIFETLRSLNTLLNASVKREIPIRFIYAIKDSIFDKIGLSQEGRLLDPAMSEIQDSALSESVRANRTKFFDLVLPVVPFITHRSARNLALRTLDDIDHEVKPELLDLAARYVPDMRLLKNVRNEFIVFRDRVISGDGAQLGLTETELYAMMLYKSTHLTDFEAIRLGRSTLDTLYDISRRLVAGNVPELEQELRRLRHRERRIDGAASRGELLSPKLVEYVDRVGSHANFVARGRTFTAQEVARSDDDLTDAEFWRAIADGPNDTCLSVNNGRGQTMTFSRTELTTALSDPLDSESWDTESRAQLQNGIVEMTEDLDFLRGTDFSGLSRRPEFLVEFAGTAQSFTDIALTLLGNGLAFQLISAGYINRNFTLYTSTFHADRVSSAATNFLIHHVDRDSMDENFQLDTSDVESVLRERGRRSLVEPALYNIAILDHLLAVDLVGARIMVESLASFGEKQRRFIWAYLNGGRFVPEFVRELTKTSPRTLVYLIAELKAERDVRLEWVSAALASLAPGKKYSSNGDVRAYLAENYRVLKALTDDPIDREQAKSIAILFASAGVKLGSLGPVSGTIRDAFVARALFSITTENLRIAVGDRSQMALDSIRTGHPEVYEYMLDDVEGYLSAVDGQSATVCASDGFAAVIEDALRHAPAYLPDVVQRAASGCSISDLSKIAEAAWESLADHNRFPASFANVRRYIDRQGRIDSSLATVLKSAGAIEVTEGVSEPEKIVLASEILASKASLPSAVMRIRLVKSLGLDAEIPVENIAPEEGELFALLLASEIIADDPATYDHLVNTSWATREEVIRESTAFAIYMTPEQVRSDLGRILQSDRVSERVKAQIASHATEFYPNATVADLSILAEYASVQGTRLPMELVESMAVEGVPTSYVVTLLQPHLPGLDREDLFTVLRHLDGGYPHLTYVGRDKPKIPNTPANIDLLNCLKSHRIVASFNAAESPIKVNKKHRQ